MERLRELLRLKRLLGLSLEELRELSRPGRRRGLRDKRSGTAASRTRFAAGRSWRRGSPTSTASAICCAGAATSWPSSNVSWTHGAAGCRTRLRELTPTPG